MSIGILLVESNFEWRDRIWSYLSHQEGMHMIGAVCSKEEALDQFQDADLIIVNNEIEGSRVEGLSIARAIKQIQPAKIILMTEHTDLDTMLEGLLAGVSRFVSQENFRDIPRIIRQITTNHAESDLSTL